MSEISAYTPGGLSFKCKVLKNLPSSSALNSLQNISIRLVFISWGRTYKKVMFLNAGAREELRERTKEPEKPHPGTLPTKPLPLRGLQIPACIAPSERQHGTHAGTRSPVLVQEKPRTPRDVGRAREKNRNRSRLKFNHPLREPTVVFLVTRFQVLPRSPAALWCALK